MADYASLKVPELKKLLNERGLPQAGNKADLIKRLQEDDGAKAAQTGDSKNEEITYDEDDGAAKSDEKPAPAATEAPKTAAPVTTVAASSDPAPTEPAAAEETTDAPETAEEATATAAEDKFAKTQADLAPTNAKTEAEKRAARAARFGIKVDEGSDEAKQKQRAERFGLANDQIRALDSALPDRPAKRGRDRADEGSRDIKRGRGQGRNQGRGNRGGGRNRQERRDGGEKKFFKGVAEDPAEKRRMDERAKRFAS